MFMVDHTKAPWAGMIFEGIPNKPYEYSVKFYNLTKPLNTFSLRKWRDSRLQHLLRENLAFQRFSSYHGVLSWAFYISCTYRIRKLMS